MLLVSPKYGCSEEILSIVSLLSVPMVFQRPPDSKKAADAAKAQFQDRHSDHCTLLTAYNAWVESGRSPDFCYDNFLSSDPDGERPKVFDPTPPIVRGKIGSKELMLSSHTTVVVAVQLSTPFRYSLKFFDSRTRAT